MASTITAGNATNGLALSCDNTGILELKTGTGAGTTAVTMDASQNATFAGNVGIGTSSATSKLHIAASGDVSGKVVNSATTGSAVFNVTNNSNALAQLMIYGSAQGAYGALGSGESAIYATTSLTLMSDTGSGVIKFATGGNTERARIDSSGNLLVGTTSVYDNSRFTLETSSAQPNGIAVKTFGNNNALAFWRNSTTYAGAITLSGSGTAYTSASDYRLKENVQPMTGALAKVAALKPCTYTWKADGSDGEGFIAHELQEVVPECVTGEKDAVDEEGNIKPQGIDTSFLVATLTAAIQELKAELDATKAEVAALKGA
jgi:hypothetical protein